MKKITFITNDKVKLDGILYNVEEKTDTVIIAVHGMTSNCFKARDEIIASYANKDNIDYFCFNNRGADLARYIKKNINGKNKKVLGGTSYENVLESYYDIVGAIQKMIELGYKNIHLQGHSLGCTKVVYTYNKLLEENNLEVLSSIRSLILLSLVDIPTVLKFYLKDKSEDCLKLAEEKVANGQEDDLMPRDCFIHPVSAKTFLQYARDYKEFDFINVIQDENLEVLNNITVPLFMRWGNIQELILQEAGQYSEKIKSIIKNKKADIGFIYGADHSYHGKEEVLGEQIINFINNI